MPKDKMLEKNKKLVRRKNGQLVSVKQLSYSQLIYTFIWGKAPNSTRV